MIYLSMKISESSNLTAEQKETIFKLWNNEYPVGVSYKSISELEDYLSKLKNQSHYFAIDENNIIRGWAFTFERDNEKWFAVILDACVQRQGIGSSLLSHLKEKETILNGWVADYNKSVKQNGEIYLSPLPFYLKNNFVVCENIRMETEKISAVKIKWVIENDSNSNQRDIKEPNESSNRTT